MQIRRQAYWAVLCGGFGHIFGNNPLWHFEGPSLYPFEGTWEQAMDLPGSKSMMHWGKLFRSRRWFDLIPDQKHEVVTAGIGEFLGNDYLAAGRTLDGNTVIAYMPTKRTIKVDMSKVSGARAVARWFDPSSGRVTEAAPFQPLVYWSLLHLRKAIGFWCSMMPHKNSHLPVRVAEAGLMPTRSRRKAAQASG